MARQAPPLSAAPPSPPAGLSLASLDDVDQALAELGRLEATEARIQADCDQALALKREEYAASFVVVLEGRAVAIADRRAELEAGIAAFAAAHRTAILPEKAKSLKLNHGEIGWRKGNPRLRPVSQPKKLGELLDTIVAILRKSLSRLKLLFDAGDAAFLDVQVTFRKPAILAACKDGALSAADLRRVGFEYDEGEENFFVKPRVQQVHAQSSAPPSASRDPA